MPGIAVILLSDLKLTYAPSYEKCHGDSAEPPGEGDADCETGYDKENAADCIENYG